jgi:hypothetical protein
MAGDGLVDDELGGGGLVVGEPPQPIKVMAARIEAPTSAPALAVTKKAIRDMIITPLNTARRRRPLGLAAPTLWRDKAR